MADSKRRHELQFANPIYPRQHSKPFGLPIAESFAGAATMINVFFLVLSDDANSLGAVRHGQRPLLGEHGRRASQEVA